ncbi:hypothetical protein CUMW_194570 [Citrus unshiu]|nr:hypothetical protein CUMW_194570 [Citrus unshiu]
MSHITMRYYNRINSHGRRSSSSCCKGKGFRINVSKTKRFSVQGLRARFVYLFRLLSRWRFSYGRALKSLILSKKEKGIFVNIKRNNSSSKRNLVPNVNSMSSQGHEYHQPSVGCRSMRSFGRSNSFYAEAIADCLEFIKRSSTLSVDQKPAAA